jgi:8-oxo-dGTP diphosphatase
MYAYTLLFIQRQESVLLLNRNRKPYMGQWNGVGGKIKTGETPPACVLREGFEETGILLKEVAFKGLLTWESDGVSGGIYLFHTKMPDDFIYAVPRETEEGVLEWKLLDWITHPNNMGVADNVAFILEKVLQDEVKYVHHCIFHDSRLLSVTTKPYIEKKE